MRTKQVKKTTVLFLSALILIWDMLVIITPVEASSNIGLKIDNIDTGTQNTPKSPFIPGDGVFVDTYPDTSYVLNQSFAIDEMGMVDFPMIGKIRVTDMSQQDLEMYLKNQYSNFLKYPMVRVKPVMRVSVLGGVIRPGLFYVDHSSSLWDVMRLAGGTTFEDGLKEMVWERDRREVSNDLIPYFEKSVSLKSMGFKSGDQLWTPATQSNFWTFFGQNILPLITFATTLIFFYYQYQRDILYLESRITR